MRDMIQGALQRAAYRTTLMQRITVFCARRVVYLLYGGVLLSLWQDRYAVTLAQIARGTTLFSAAATLGKLMSQRIDAPRPFVLNGVPPLVPAKPDEGFPSIHAIQAWALTANVWNLQRRYVPFMSVGMLIVVYGRLGANLHRTRDIIGGLGVTAAVALAVQRLLLPATWERPLLGSPARRH